MSKIYGIERRTGEYNGKHYDNYYIYTNIDTDCLVCGTAIIATKIKSAVLHQYVKEDQVKNLIGHEIVFYCDSTQYHNIIKVEIN